MFTYKPDFTLKSKILLLCLLFSASNSFAAVETIQEVAAIKFANTPPTTGSCELDPFSGTASSPSTFCISSGGSVLGHYRITGDPGRTLKIILTAVYDAGQGILFEPKGRLVNNVDGAVSAPIAGDETLYNIGSDGFLDIYIGGSLTVTQSLNSSATINLTYQIDYLRP